jgi:16S rRNA (adenine1518-N6/adenine1519-N6)-dimethyltransferase
MGRKLGQHFLKDRRALAKITAAIKIGLHDTIIEIGPGHGELTQYILAANPYKLIAIERDPRLASELRKKFQDKNKKLKIIEGDALKVLPTLYTKYKLQNTNYKIAGDIPYYITGYLLRTLGELEPKPELIVLTIQKEVAERVCAAPPKMNLLAASVQFWAKPKIEFIIKSGAFSPPPKVDSAVLKLEPRAMEDVNPKQYYRLIKILFKQPRKTILNNLISFYPKSRSRSEQAIKRLKINPSNRPQNLSISNLCDMIKIIK